LIDARNKEKPGLAGGGPGFEEKLLSGEFLL
jgi:hypothetical protein